MTRLFPFVLLLFASPLLAQPPCADAASNASGGLLTLPACVEVTWSADFTGRPPITVQWQADTGQVFTGNPATIDTRHLPAGLRRLTARATNSAGTHTFDSFLVVEALRPAVPQLVPLAGLTIQATSPASTGATDWRYCWGDGSCTPWILDHCRPPARTHTYTAPGTYPVTLTGRNCRDGQAVSSATVITVPSVGIDRFQVQGCAFGFCSFTSAQTLVFDQGFINVPDIDEYRYDWNGDGAADQLSSAPITTHRYLVSGAYRPILSVRSGSFVAEKQHDQWIVISGGQAIFIDGFESGNTAAWSASVPD